MKKKVSKSKKKPAKAARPAQAAPVPATPPPATKATALQPHQFAVNGEVLTLRRTGKEMKSHGGFVYPSEVGAVVTCPDWMPSNECGHGLHGWPWGFGIGEGSDFSVCDDVFMVIGAKPEDVVGELGGGYKCKLRTGVVRYIGGHKGAADLLWPGMTDCIVQMAKGAGDYAKNASSGDSAKNASSGDYAKNASSGYYAKNASSGHYATNASSGDYATNASSGHYATNEASGADSTCACAGYNGRVKVGSRGAFALAYEADDGPRFICGKVGENGIKADTWYRVTAGKLEEV